MEFLGNVEKEVDKVISKFGSLKKSSADDFIMIETLGEKLNQSGKDLSQLKREFSEWILLIKKTTNKLSQDHKDLHASVSKVGKTIDKNFTSDFSSVFIEGAFKPEGCEEMDRVIRAHLLQSGLMGVAQSLVKESKLKMEDLEVEPFEEIHSVVEALNRKELLPAFQWVETNREKLESISSVFEFKLHKLKFIQLLLLGIPGQTEALRYSKNFQPFAQKFSTEISSLMGPLAFLKHGLENSPYEGLRDEGVWEEVVSTFMSEASILLNLPLQSPLSTVVHAGCLALTPLLNMKQVIQQHSAAVWSDKDELPIEIDVGSDCMFHSIFACPILRQQTTDTNPPFRLICGHVVSRDALQKLTSSSKWSQINNPLSQKVKCPYCPVEQSPSEAKQIFF